VTDEHDDRKTAFVERLQSDSRATKGEMKREADGSFRYFDGHCWTVKPMPPQDTPL
jgi:hypothetical protein